MRLPAGHPLRELPGVGVAYKLIQALYDREIYVALQAVKSLRALSGENFGDDTKAWTSWWKENRDRMLGDERAD